MEELRSNAISKIQSKLMMGEVSLRKLKDDYKSGLHQGVDREHQNLVILRMQHDIKVYQYILDTLLNTK